MGIVSYDLDNLPPLTEEQQARLDALAAMPDDEIDCSDIPEATEEQLARMRPFREVVAEFRARQKEKALV
ncbi:MAG: hypothetical protein FWG02_00015 [Holophagaceae bacterium]|nr:hypothetical protein [Holophagaceae bacterium]